MRKLLLVTLSTAWVFICAVSVDVNSAEARSGPRHGTILIEKALDGVALNAAAASRTWTVDAEGWSLITFWVDFTHNNNGTLTITCTGGPTSSDRDYDLTTCTVASGTCTLNDAGVLVTGSLSADKKYGARMDISAFRDLSCVIAHGGTPDASDLVTLHYELEAE